MQNRHNTQTNKQASKQCVNVRESELEQYTLVHIMVTTLAKMFSNSAE
jgi:hypothetical protein